MFVAKFWKEVKDRLEDCKYTTYYVGGTLSLGLSPTRAIALNLDGTAFVINEHTQKNDKMNALLYQPEFILSRVRSRYLKTKGETEHYKNELKRYEALKQK